MTSYRQLLPDDWPVIAAALVQLRLYRRALTSNIDYVMKAALLLRYPLHGSSEALHGLETRLSEALDELRKELE